MNRHQPVFEATDTPATGAGCAAVPFAASEAFAPTPAAARARLAAVRAGDYARSRNHLDGAVTRLSPYLTHGLLDLAEVVASLRKRHHLPLTHKLVQELGWRAYFQHSWRHRGAAIFDDLHPGPLPAAAYARELPADLRRGATGVPVIDQAVRTLYASGYLHNHARMWLASYTVHVRKVHWRAGADWMFAHLLDGDLASNHLSWQWVAGTGSAKPYLFNAENVARYAPPAWHSPGTVIDTTYAVLDALAHSPQRRGAEPGAHPAVDEPPLFAAPPAEGFTAPDAATVAGRTVWLVHPWALADPPAGTLPVAVLDTRWHARWPWSAQRWAFVGARMHAIASLRWMAPAPELVAALRPAAQVRGWYNPHLDDPAWAALRLPLPPSAFADPDRACRSFSAYWTHVLKHAPPGALPQGVLSND
ncbi:MAG: FAD-binding domain-containing protein [Tepidimonas sp.]|uniref:FAD-binding domain-containing protein n=1 Tax=Tepidimonas sp. TaxID=2002775 RepID=UPI00259F60E1|nr:FAD-binding domain-containing protein [Tepidimonas sp.]MDM7457022.1 FAD-binding domain-containing protein [Tepidimonas sp.]